MSESITDQGAIQEPGITPAAATDTTTEPTLKELNDRFMQMEAEHKKATAELEERKKEISGLNRKISEDEKTIKQKELEKLSGIEREKAEAELIRAENAKIKQENAELERKRIIDSELFNSGIPSEFAKRINGQTPEEIQADVKEFNDFINKRVIELKEKAVNDALSGKAPEVGNLKKLNEREQLISKYNDAEKRGDGAAMFQIKEKIRSLPKE